MLVICNNIIYKTQKDFKAYARNLIYKDIGICENVLSHNKYADLLGILKRHPDFEVKMKNMKLIKIQQEPFQKGNQIVIINDDNSETFISFITAISGKPMSHHAMLRDALRNSIDDQIKAFRSTKNFCETCKITKHLEVDHIIRFEYLVRNFLSTQNEWLIPKTFGKMDDMMHRNCFLKEDCVFNKAWVEYHRENATLQILCRSCNSMKH